MTIALCISVGLNMIAILLGIGAIVYETELQDKIGILTVSRDWCKSQSDKWEELYRKEKQTKKGKRK